MCVVLLALTGRMIADTKSWPQFRGKDSRGVSENRDIPDRWSANENVGWKKDIPGRGWSSPVVVNNKVFLTTVINEGESEAPKKGLYFGGDRPKPVDAIHHWQVICLDLASGKELWKKELHKGKPAMPIHIKSSYASETPVTDGENLYCYFGNIGIFCLDLEGNTRWKHSIDPLPMRLGWGTASSPVLFEDRLYVVNDNEKESYLLALDKKTGNQVWRVSRDEKSNWATPFIWKNAKRTEIITPGTGLVRSYDLNGQLLWTLKGMSSITIATPFEANGLLYVSSGYVLDPSKPLYAIRPAASGDISLKDGATSNEWIAWSNPKAAPYNPSTLVYKDLLYVLYDRGMFSCYASQDGRLKYGPERLPNGKVFTASPWACNDRVFCLNEDGVTFVIQPGDAFKVLHTNKLAEDDMCMATPAIVGNRLLIRTSARIYCIEKGAGTGSASR